MNYKPEISLLEPNAGDGLEITSVLRMTGHGVVIALDEEELDETLARTRVEIVLIGRGVALEQGTTISKRLTQAYPGLCIIRLMTCDAISDRVLSYDNGACLCLYGSSALSELPAAVGMFSRRLLANANSHASICLDIPRREIKSADHPAVALNVVELTLLKALSQAPSLKLPYYQLLELFEADLDEKSKAALEVHIARLRKKLNSIGASAPAIRAIRNEGYQLTEPVIIL